MIYPFLALIPLIRCLEVFPPEFPDEKLFSGIIDYKLMDLGNVPYGKQINGEGVFANPISGCKLNRLDKRVAGGFFLITDDDPSCNHNQKALNA